MTRALPLLLALSALGAPFQCTSEPDPTLRREETPGEALWMLAQSFDQAGDREGRIRTLRFLVDRYPRSRYAHDAYEALTALGIQVRDPSDASGALADEAYADPAHAAPSAPSPPAGASASEAPPPPSSPVP